MAEDYRAEKGKIVAKGTWSNGQLLTGGPGETTLTIKQAQELHQGMRREQGAGDPLGAAIKKAKMQRLMFWRR